MENEHGSKHIYLNLRNIFAVIAFIIFMASLFAGELAHHMRGIAYFFGAAAYFCEILELTDGFHKKVPFPELLMAVLFAPMYIILGISYLL